MHSFVLNPDLLVVNKDNVVVVVVVVIAVALLTLLTFVDVCRRCRLFLQDMWQPLLNVQKYRWLKHSVYGGSSSQSSLMATIVEFVLKEEPLDVEKMRKCLLKQVTVVCVCVCLYVCLYST